MKRPYCCEASRDMYRQYYASQQSGRGMPVYSGVLRQKGHGIGNVIGSLFRGIVPFLGRAALTTGANVAGDLISGRKFTETMKHRLPEGIKGLASSVINQSGSGLRKRKRRQRKKNKKTKREVDKLF
jgi:hypothetical protein